MKKILVVDDDKDIRDLTQKKLERNNYVALTAADGQEALALCGIKRPDLVLLDIAMPQMDGYALAMNLRKNKCFQDTPIIFLTGKELTPEGIIKRISEFGSCDFIIKPYRFEELLEKIKKILAE